jgi:hypothetical protein
MGENSFPIHERVEYELRTTTQPRERQSANENAQLSNQSEGRSGQSVQPSRLIIKRMSATRSGLLADQVKTVEAAKRKGLVPCGVCAHVGDWDIA